MIVLPRAFRRVVLPTAVVAAVVLTSTGSPQGGEGLSAADPTGATQVAQPSVRAPVVAAAMTPLPVWDGPHVPPTIAPPAMDLGPVPPFAPDSVAVPEPSMILLLVGGLCLSFLARGRRHPPP